MNTEDDEPDRVAEAVTTALELAATVLLAVAACLVAVALVGGLLGVGVGLVGSALVLAGAAAVLRALQRPDPTGAVRPEEAAQTPDDGRDGGESA